MKQTQRETLIRETLTFEFESDSERREFLKYINDYGKSAVVVEKDGTHRTVTNFENVIEGRTYNTAKEFVLSMVKQFGRDGVKFKELMTMLSDSKVFISPNTVSASLCALNGEGKITKSGPSRYYVYRAKEYGS